MFELPLHLLLTHGYLALFIWSVFEGEIGLMLAGWLASHHEVFSYEKVIAIAIAGALIGDMSVFIMGRLFEKRARAWLDAHPKKRDLAMAWLRRWGEVVIVFERFIYGTHIPVLLTIGMSGFSFWKFFIADVAGVVLWAFTFVTIGYKFGDSVIEFVVLFQKNFTALFFLLLLFLLARSFVKKKAKGD